MSSIPPEEDQITSNDSILPENRLLYFTLFIKNLPVFEGTLEKLRDLDKSTGIFHETLPIDGAGYGYRIAALSRRLTGLFWRYYAEFVPDRSEKKWTYLVIDTTYENFGAYVQ